ncbi:hypothetical protein [Aquibacillus sediminis]|uniref:hypothetical protein n=1 Tax=Aquibacillus sediminis TaxID=2574734 RepID=UPI0011082B88|nr:hypothetical protein [Aquibacillus sediminis]
MKYKKLLITSCIANVLLVIFATFFVVKFNQAEETLVQNEQNLLREFVKNQESIKIELNSSLNDTNEFSEIDLTTALTLNFANIKLFDDVSIPNDLERFHTDLNVYIHNLLIKINDETLHSSDAEDIKTVIDTLTNYQKELNFNFYDSPTEIKKKLEIAEKEVITPFLKSNSNPF